MPKGKSEAIVSNEVKCQNVLISREDILEQFFNTMSNLPGSAQLIESIYLIHDSYLASISNEALASSTNDWKSKLIQKLDSIKHLESFSDIELEAFKGAIHDHMELDSIDVEKDSVLPNILLITPNPSKAKQRATLIYNSASKKKIKITLDQFRWINSIFSNLKSFRSSNINFKIEKNDVINEENDVESIDITLGNIIASPTTLLNSIISCYHKSVKNIKLVTGERKDKWLPYDGNMDELEDILSFGNTNVKLKQLESVNISFFSYMINTDRFLDELVKTECNLKNLTLLGCVYGRTVLYTVTNYYDHSLESLELSTEYYCDPSELKNMKKLQHFSYTWENLGEKVDILKMLMMVPNITSLEIGYNRLYGDLVNNVVNLDSYENLTHLSLHRLNMEGNELHNIQDQLPSLNELHLTNCKFGKSRTENEATLDLRNYSLEKLVVDSCSLFFSKKEKKSKRLITKFNFGITQEDHYATAIESNLNDTNLQGRLFAEGNHFTYETSKHNNFALLIQIISIKKFSCQKTFHEYVSFVPESVLKSSIGLNSEEEVVDSSVVSGDEEEEQTNDSTNEDTDGSIEKDGDYNENEETDNLIEEDSDDNEKEAINNLIEEYDDSNESKETNISLNEDQSSDDNTDKEINSSLEEVQSNGDKKSDNDNINEKGDASESEEEIEDYGTPLLHAADFGFDLDDNINYNDEDDVMYTSDKNQSSIESCVEEDLLNSSNSEEEYVISTITKNRMPYLKEKKQSFSDLDYTSNEESADDSTDSEYEHNEVRRSTRRVKLISVNSLRKRKRKARSYYESDENGDDPIDDEMINKFISNVRKYRAVVRLKTKPVQFNFERSPSL